MVSKEKSVRFNEQISMKIVATEYDLPEFYKNCKILKSTLDTKIPLLVDVPKIVKLNNPTDAKVSPIPVQNRKWT